MAVTGLILLGFVIVHMLGNLQIFLGQDQLNSYAEHIKDLPAILWPVRFILLSALIMHMTMAISLAVENKRARPVKYCYEDSVQVTFASRTMVLTGLLVFVFIVYHLLHFTFDKIHPEFSNLTDSKGRDDVYSMVVLSFQDPLIAGSYVAAMFILYLHLSHGAPNFLQSLGLNNENVRRKIQLGGHLLAVIIFVGNCSIVLASFFHILKVPKGMG